MGIEPTALWDRPFLRRPALTFSGVLSSPRESPLNPALAAAHPTRLPTHWGCPAACRRGRQLAFIATVGTVLGEPQSKGTAS